MNKILLIVFIGIIAVLLAFSTGLLTIFDNWNTPESVEYVSGAGASGLEYPVYSEDTGWTHEFGLLDGSTGSGIDFEVGTDHILKFTLSQPSNVDGVRMYWRIGYEVTTKAIYVQEIQISRDDVSYSTAWNFIVDQTDNTPDETGWFSIVFRGEEHSVKYIKVIFDRTGMDSWLVKMTEFQYSEFTVESDTTPPIDSDGDTIPDVNDDELDSDIDDDGIPNNVDDDMDGDGYLNYEDEDANGNGISDLGEIESSEGIPGFELLSLIASLGVAFILLWRKKL